MEAKHTQGEWLIEYTDEYLEPKCSTIEIQTKSNSGWICKVQNNGIVKKDEGLANARLIAAAPDLLCACEELISLLKFHGYLHSAEISKAQQAINKAKGE